MILRFSSHQRLAHFVGSISGMFLLITGLTIMFPNQLQWVTLIFGGHQNVMLIHRIFAIVLIFSFVYFGVYFILERATRGSGDSNIKNFGFSASLIKEVMEGAVKDILWTLNLQKERPKFGKYDWIMVADIFGIPILAVIEIVTGAIMWFPRAFPFVVADPGFFFLARAIHAAVAFFLLLFVLAHAGILHLTPGNFPMNMSIFSGYVPEEKAAHEHQKWVKVTVQNGGVQASNPLSYIFGAITIFNLALLAYIPFIMRTEGFAGLRIDGNSYVAAIGLSLAAITVIVYIIATIVGGILGVSKK